MNDSFTQTNNGFQQTRANRAKMGAYYTDVSHCMDISKMFRFSTEEETCVLEPSCGDCSAVKAVTKALANPMIKIFGVELNDGVADMVSSDPNVFSVLKGDFLNDLECRNHFFSFCFSNPPYMDEDALDAIRFKGDKTERVERKFLEKIATYMRTGGILAWVVPHRIFAESNHISFWMSRFETLACYKFRGSEFAKFGQLVVIGRRRAGICGVMGTDKTAMLERLTLDNIDELPNSFTEEQMIDVPTSPVETLGRFRARKFDGEAAISYVKSHTKDLSIMMSGVGQLIKVPEYRGGNILVPPVPLSKANRALAISCGVGSGEAGTDGVDLHLQRGCVTEIEQNELLGEGVNQKCVVSTRAKVNVTIIESDGEIRELV